MFSFSTGSGNAYHKVSVNGVLKVDGGMSEIPVKTGDLIEIDVEARKISVRLTDLDLRIRISRWQAPEQKRRGFLERYSRQVSEAHEGAVLK